MARHRRSSSLGADILRGALAGGAGTWLMDLVTTGVLHGQSDEVTARERAARPDGRSSVGNLVARIEDALGLELDERTRSLLAQAIHYGLGVVPGALYAVARRRLPLVGAGGGVLYGLLLFAVNDEYLNTALGLAGPFDAYPIETHMRGLVGHVVLGGTTDTVLDLLGA